MSRKIIEIKHHLSSGCCMCSGIEVCIVNNDNKVIDMRGVKVWIGIFWSI